MSKESNLVEERDAMGGERDEGQRRGKGTVARWSSLMSATTSSTGNPAVEKKTTVYSLAWSGGERR